MKNSNLVSSAAKSQREPWCILHLQIHTNDKPQDCQEPPAKKKKETAITFLLGDRSDDDVPVATGREEVKELWKEPTLHIDDHPLEWWERHESFSNVSKTI